MQCQRLFTSLTDQVKKCEAEIERRAEEKNRLEDRLLQTATLATGYAIAVQYFATKLKLDSDVNLMVECEQLKSKLNELQVEKSQFQTKLDALTNDNEKRLQVELDLRNNIQKRLDDTIQAYKNELEQLKTAHNNQLIDLKEEHTNEVTNLQSRNEILDADLVARQKELAELKREFEVLTENFNKLEESLTKDKDARVKYAQEKISQLQKDKESLETVLEMRLDRIHTLEKKVISFDDMETELGAQTEVNKTLNQQIESLNAALNIRREQSEKLTLELENLKQDLRQERKERRRITMRTEQLEYVLNESCASESNMVFNSSVHEFERSNDGVVDKI